MIISSLTLSVLSYITLSHEEAKLTNCSTNELEYLQVN